MSAEFFCNFDSPVVQTDKGLLRGYYAKGVFKFKGIKYANANRYRSPRDVEPWDGVKDALAYGKVAPTIENKGTAYEKLGILVEYRWMPEDEDCQYLNVWTKSIDCGAKKPVMVWLHGGGFFCGNTTEFEAYEPENLCKDGDVVIVSINHRLNILGFLDLSEYGDEFCNSGNLGMEDIIAALKWVKKNIAAFGGDSNNITLFGHSGGGMKITTLMQIPEASPLFDKAIIQSGVNSTDFLRITPDKSKVVAKAVVNEIGGIDRLMTARFRDISDAFIKIEPDLRRRRLGEWGPVENGWYLGDPLYCETTEKFKTTPLIVGSLIAEPLMWEGAYYDGNASEDVIIGYLRERYGEHTYAMIELFKKTYPGKNLIVLRYLDTEFRHNILKYLDKRAAQADAPTYSYMLAFEFNLNGCTPAFHSAEHGLIFRSMDRMDFLQVDGVQKLSDEMSMAWVSFARTGDPNNSFLPERWLPYKVGDEHTFVFDKVSECRTNYDAELYKYMQSYCPIRILPFDK